MRWLLLTFIVLSSLMFGGCEIVGGIFKAGVWVGVIAVVLVLLLVGFLATKLRCGMTATGFASRSGAMR